MKLSKISLRNFQKFHENFETFKHEIFIGHLYAHHYAYYSTKNFSCFNQNMPPLSRFVQHSHYIAKAKPLCT